MDDRQFPITFAPHRRCHDAECERLTHWGMAEYWSSDRDFRITPLCWEHGYCEPPSWKKPTAEDTKNEYASIVRFVLGYHGDQGTATVLAPCAGEDVPGYIEYRPEDYEDPGAYENLHMEDQCWHVRFDLDGAHKYFYVVWRYDDWTFELYQ